MDNIFFSIIVPTYNRASFLTRTVSSVLNQTFLNFEVIIVDDGSEDETFSVVKELSEQDIRVNYYYQQNSERAVARNNGAKIAKGKFLIFLDSDDFFNDKVHLSNLFEFIKTNNEVPALYFTGAIITTSDKQILTRNYIQEELNQIDFFVKESVVPARVCVSKSVFDFFKFDEDCIVVEDTVLWTAIMQKFPVFYLPIHTASYFLHESNSVNLNSSNAYFNRLKGLKKMFNYYEVGKIIPIKTKQSQINRCYYGISEYYRNKNKFILSKCWILISIIRYPMIDIKHKLKQLFLR